VLLGAIVAFGAAYFAWMREDPAAAAKLAPARRLTPAPPKSDDGVTAAESAMLFPAHPEEEAEVSPARPIPAPAKPVKPLYPEDVRLKGEIPSGAKPLSNANAAAAAPAMPAVPEPAVYRWTAPRAAAAAADPTRIGQEEIEALADVAPPIPEPEGLVEEVAEIAEEAEVPPMPPRPTWETTGLTEDDEPVDAYGTPLSLVEKARRDRDEAEEDADEVAPVVAARIPREIGAPESDEELDADLLEDEVEAPVEVAVIAVAEVALEPAVLEPQAVEDEALAVDDIEVDALEAEQAAAEQAGEAAVRSEVSSLLAEQESLLQALRANNAALRADADAEEEYDALEVEVAAAVVEVEPAADLEDALAEDEELEEVEALAADEELAEAELEEEELLEAASADEVAPEELEPALAEAGLPEEIEAELPEAAPEPEPVAAPAPARAKVAAAAAPSLFDAVETEPEVVLKPQAAVPASRAEKAPGRGIDPEKKLLVEVGCMFVERGRVAVSMLQRQYDMDFDQACRVLDDLQEMGLIGPYMGGKSRDILLTKEQWMEKVGAAVS